MKEIHKITEPKKLSPLCQNDCKVCNSGYTEKIHEMIKANATYKNICVFLKREKNFEISPASISRHYKHYKEYQRILLQKKLTEENEIKADELVDHQKKAIVLADLVYDNLLVQFNSGHFNVDISDWEKVVKMYHQVLLGKGEGDGGKSLKVIFEQMQDKYGSRRQQMALKFGGDDAPAEQKSQDGKEEH